MSRTGKSYYITFVNDHSKYIKAYLLRSKDEMEEIFIKYKAELENHLNKIINGLKSDQGGQYNVNTLRTCCEKSGIIHETTSPYTQDKKE